MNEIRRLAARPTQRTTSRSRSSSISFYVWTAIVLAVAVDRRDRELARRRRHDGSDRRAPAGHRLSHTTVVLDSAILVFREGLETILVLAAITASFLGANKVYRRPVAAGGALALGAGVGTWFGVIWIIGQFTGSEHVDPGRHRDPGADRPADRDELVLPQGLLDRLDLASPQAPPHACCGADAETNKRRMLLGLGLLGFTSVYRECFEIVIFLQSLRQIYGPGVVLEGVVIGLLFTGAVGVLTFALHQRLPYRRLLIITGVLLLFVLLVQVGEEVNEMQLAGWIGTTEIHWLHHPRLDGHLAQPLQQLGDLHRPGHRAGARRRLLRARPVPPGVGARAAAARSRPAWPQRFPTSRPTSQSPPRPARRRPGQLGRQSPLARAISQRLGCRRAQVDGRRLGEAARRGAVTAWRANRSSSGRKIPRPRGDRRSPPGTASRRRHAAGRP